MSCKCQKCFTDFIVGAPSFVQVNALLQASSAYVWELIDGFGNIYHQEFTTDSNGIGSINMGELPAGFANAAQAPLKIRVKESALDCDYVPLVIAQSFLEIAMDFKAGTATKDWIACAISAPTPAEHVTYSDVYSEAYN